MSIHRNISEEERIRLGRMLLHHLAQHPHEQQTCLSLIRRGAMLDIEDSMPGSNAKAIFWAISIPDTKILQEMILHGVDINTKDRNGDTPTNIAVQSGNESALKLLIDSGARVNDANLNGETPLMMAARDGKQKCVTILCAAGADMTARNHNGEDAAILAETNDHPVIAAFLRTEIRRKENERAEYERFLKNNMPVPILPKKNPMQIKKPPKP